MFNLAILRRKKRNILDRNDSKNEMYQSPKIMAVQIIKKRHLEESRKRSMEISNAVMNQNKPLLKQLTVHETIYLEFLKG